ncbi:MAG: hypothetical protein K1X83_08080 [Oligoflexia bacterium]|nr:hypothetical protein [Oligoflexia bacterium]
MDIYRFFHPHHNPRLHSTPLRQQELSELEQAAAELRKALERAQQRTARRAATPIMPEHFNDIIKAMRFVEASMETLCNSHRGDNLSELSELIRERVEFSGWEVWTKLLGEQIACEGPSRITVGNSEESEDLLEARNGMPKAALMRDAKAL